MKKSIMVVGVAAALSLPASVQAEEQPRITHDWPAYYGPDGTYADLTKVPILADLSQAELVWTSEHADLGYGKSSSSGGHGYGPKSRPSGSADLIVSHGLVIQGYFHPKNNVVADDILLALDAATGETKWKQVYAEDGYNRAAGKASVQEADGKSKQAALECLVSHGEAAVPTLMAMLEGPAEERPVGLTALGMLGDKAKAAQPPGTSSRYSRRRSRRSPLTRTTTAVSSPRWMNT